MPTKPMSKIEDQLRRANLAINNSLADEEIKALVAPRGYTTDKLNAGKALYEAAQTAVSGKTGVHGARKDATSQVDQSQAAARLAYQDLAKTARKAFRDDKAKLAILGLSGAEPDSTAGFLNAARTLFDNAQTPAVQAVLQDYGYTRIPRRRTREDRRFRSIRSIPRSGQRRVRGRYPDAAAKIGRFECVGLHLLGHRPNCPARPNGSARKDRHQSPQSTHRRAEKPKRHAVWLALSSAPVRSVCPACFLRLHLQRKCKCRRNIFYSLIA